VRRTRRHERSSQVEGEHQLFGLPARRAAALSRAIDLDERTRVDCAMAPCGRHHVLKLRQALEIPYGVGYGAGGQQGWRAKA